MTDLRSTKFDLFVGDDGDLHIVTEDAVRCGECGAAHFFFVNRDGKTMCTGCDGQRARKAVA